VVIAGSDASSSGGSDSGRQGGCGNQQHEQGRVVSDRDPQQQRLSGGHADGWAGRPAPNGTVPNRAQPDSPPQPQAMGNGGGSSGRLHAERTSVVRSRRGRGNRHKSTSVRSTWHRKYDPTSMIQTPDSLLGTIGSLNNWQSPCQQSSAPAVVGNLACRRSGVPSQRAVNRQLPRFWAFKRRTRCRRCGASFGQPGVSRRWGAGRPKCARESGAGGRVRRRRRGHSSR
jgi:hypothetical protein